MEASCCEELIVEGTSVEPTTLKCHLGVWIPNFTQWWIFNSNQSWKEVEDFFFLFNGCMTPWIPVVCNHLKSMVVFNLEAELQMGKEASDHVWVVLWKLFFEFGKWNHSCTSGEVFVVLLECFRGKDASIHFL